MNSETAIDKARKAEQQVDNLNTEISQLHANLQKSESAKSNFEKQVGIWIGMMIHYAATCMVVSLRCISTVYR